MTKLIITSLGLATLFVFSRQSKISSSKNFDVPKEIYLGNTLLAYPSFKYTNTKQLAPMVIVLHGRGGNEMSLQKIIPVDLAARVFFIRANLSGNLFFKPRLIEPSEIVTPAIKTAGHTLLVGLKKLLAIYPTNNLIILEFSQGTELALYLGSIGQATNIISLAGGLPVGLYPVKKKRTPSYLLQKFLCGMAS